MLCRVEKDTNGLDKYTMLTMRNTPRMALFNTSISGNTLSVWVDRAARPWWQWIWHNPVLQVSLRPVEESHAYTEMEVMLHKNKVRGLDMGRDISRIFSDFLQDDVRLVQKLDQTREVKHRSDMAPDSRNSSHPLAFPDQYPLLILSAASLKYMDDELWTAGKGSLGIDRFRPNFIISGVSKAFAEDHWTELDIGGHQITVVGPCARCLLPNVDTRTGKRSDCNQPFKLLNETRKTDPHQPLKPVLGVYAILESNHGRLAVGDDVVVVR